MATESWAPVYVFAGARDSQITVDGFQTSAFGTAPFGVVSFGGTPGSIVTEFWSAISASGTTESWSSVSSTGTTESWSSISTA